MMQMVLSRKRIDDSYRIVFGGALFKLIAKDLKNMLLGSKYAIVTDYNVEPLYAHSLKSSMEAEGLPADIFSFAAGEQNKTRATKEKIEDEMICAGYGRDTVVIALGGGVVGDLAGFIAATFNRGVPYIQVPTTLLAQADSSIGGKVAVDTPYGKNLIGAFNQPKRVYIDVDTLSTLSDRDLRNGLVETIKHGIILDPNFFKYLQDGMGAILARDPHVLFEVARGNCRIKGSVVEEDPYEQGLRRVLNYGHTIGHAIEQLSNYELPHGEAVSIGMMAAARISNMLGYFPEKDIVAQKNILENIGLPTSLPDGMSIESIIDATARDKKAKAGRVRYVLPLRIGKMHEFDGAYTSYVDNDIVIKALEQTR